MQTECNKYQPGCCKRRWEKLSTWVRYATKCEDKVGASSQGSPNEGELADKEVVEPKCEEAL
jgi:hypothetical protein